MNCRLAEVPNGRIEANRTRARFAALRRAATLVMATLREIFDENAYARFLARSGTAASRCSYAAFLRESQRARERRPRCC